MPNSLAAFVEEFDPENHLRVQDNLGDGFVRLKVDEAQKRQAAQDIRCTEDALLELMRNSRDAHAHSIYVAISKEASDRIITVIDDGDGIPLHLQETVFEPLVTSKLDTFHEDTWGVHGRGMALYSIKVNAESARVLSSHPGLGSAFQAVFDLSRVREKADQSSFPSFTLEPNGHVKITGPKNLLRTSCEFALAHRSTLTVYIGSPSEIAATMFQNAILELPLRDRLAGESGKSAYITQRLAYCADKGEFADSCTALGLAISERTAYRVMEGEIDPVDDLAHIIRRLLNASIAPKAKRSKPGNAFTPKIQEADLSRIADSATREFARISDSYYLQAYPQASAQVRDGAIRISIPLIPIEQK